MNLFDLTGKTALVTGGEGNLGPIWMRTLRDAGAEAFSLGLPAWDFSDPQDIPNAYTAYMQAVKRVPDIIVCNAAIDTPPTKTEARFFTDVEKTVQVNLLSHCRLLERFIPSMVENGGGTIVLVGSIMGVRGAVKRNYEGGFQKPVGYNLSKAAFVQLARSITTEYGDKNIRAVTIAFGPFNGGKLSSGFLDKFLRDVPLGRPVSKQSVQTALLFACCCPELAGQMVLVDGGFCA